MAMCIYPATCMMLEGAQNKEDSRITTLLEAYNDVFEVPTTLPPKRMHDHRIPLEVGTAPVNIWPYKNPPTQKDAIVVMVRNQG